MCRFDFMPKRKQSKIQRELAAVVRAAQKENQWLVDQMPDCKARTAEQKKIQKVSGTPKKFAADCVKAIGEISPLEAMIAVRDYLARWNSVG